ncbi:MATE efflux family protein DTX1 [Hordeum vulgare]|nr:MATE efflux family protein DTX1 [Hordeum vulgare]
MSSVDAAGNPLRAFTSATSLLSAPLVGLGSKGAALASAVSDSTYLAILCLYTRLSGACRRTWTGFSMEAFAFKELRQFAELAVPSTMMVCLNTGALMFTVSYGLCAAIRWNPHFPFRYEPRIYNNLEPGIALPSTQHIADVILTQFDHTREVPTTLLLYLPTTTTAIQSIPSRARSATLVRIPIASLLFGTTAEASGLGNPELQPGSSNAACPRSCIELEREVEAAVFVYWHT